MNLKYFNTIIEEPESGRSSPRMNSKGTQDLSSNTNDDQNKIQNN